MSARSLRQLFDLAIELDGPQRAQFIAELDADTAARLQRLLALAGDDRQSDADASAAAPSAPVALSRELERRRAHQIEIAGYRLLNLLGQGGMGEVWLAERAVAGQSQRVALKLLRPGLLATDALRRFREEQRILLSLSNANIARLLDAGEESGTPWIAMEYVEGEPITQWCDRQQLTLDRRLELFERVCLAVQHAHDHLIVHRDIKPANVLVDSTGNPKLLDFGIAKSLTDVRSQARTETANTMFSLYGVAPEQMLARQPSVSTDVYGLGALLYELVCGHPSFDFHELSPATIESWVLHRSPELPSARAIGAEQASARGLRSIGALQQALRGDLDRIVLHAMRKEPGERYPSVRALAEDLRRFREHEPVLAVGQGRAYRVRKFLWRHRYVSSAAALALTALLVLTAMLAVGAVQLREQRDSARLAQARTEAVNEFLVGMFRDADPTRTLKARTTATEVLQAGIARIERHSVDGAVAAPVMLALARSARGIGDVPAAERLSERASQLFADPAVPARDKDRFDLAMLQIDLAYARGRTEDLQAAIVQATRWLDPKDAVARSELDLHRIRGLIVAKQEDRALDQLRQRLEAAGSQIDADALQLEAGILLRRGAFQELADALDGALARLRAEGTPSLNLVQLLQARSAAARGLGQHRQALALADEAVQSAEAMVGTDHLFTEIQRITRANALANLNQAAEAVRAYQQILDRLVPKLGSEDALVRMTRFNLANVASSDESVAGAERAVALQSAQALVAGLSADAPMRHAAQLALLRLQLLSEQAPQALATLAQLDAQIQPDTSERTRRHLLAWRMVLNRTGTLAEREAIAELLLQDHVDDNLLLSRLRAAPR